ncbi:hypothetical protein MTP99_015179 [Tenebrio molitor]|nr:hypothetical protein MTP99_015179 [Tenebrio molitor]
MLDVPKHILKKLQCVQCGGYLSNGPIMVNKHNEQLCGRCFKISPESVKTEYVRQVGLEAVAELLIFPCRYNIQGCPYTSQWNKGIDHEAGCPHRYDTLPLEEILSSKHNISNECLSKAVGDTEFTYTSSSVEMKVEYDSALEGEEIIKLSIDISGKNDNNLYLSNNINSQSARSVTLGLGMVISPKVVPMITDGYVCVKKQETEPIYEKVSYIPKSISCANCQKNILNSEIFYCPFSHSLCRFCKNNLCYVCGIASNSTSKHYCKNYTRGCTDLFETENVRRHEIDCEFNNHKCPLCEFIDSLNNFITHFVREHDRVISSNELSVTLSRKDQDWYFYCYNKLFHCRYYNFVDSVEFIVMYVGSNNNARRYKYEVGLLTGQSENLKKTAKCLGWNETTLGRAVEFEVANNLRQNLQVHMQIL